MRILITGANGFLGKNLAETLRAAGCHTLYEVDLETSEEAYRKAAADCEFVFHLAGVNRPKDEKEFLSGNCDALTKLLLMLESAHNPVPVMLSSSIQALLDNPYGQSKRAGEEALFAYGRKHGVPVYAFRFPNLFGKWSRPNYNSAVATFCHNIARGLPIIINDPNAALRLLYVDDAVSAMLSCLDGRVPFDGEFALAAGELSTSVGEAASLIESFAAARRRADIPDQRDPLSKKLYATYVSFLPENDFSVPLNAHADERGSFTELLHSPERGQVSINISKPGVTKGGHWHHTKNEKFIVVSGEAVIKLRRIGDDTVIEYRVSGEKPESVDIPAGYAHSIENVGKSELVTVMWASECFDPDHPDTFREEV